MGKRVWTEKEIRAQGVRMEGLDAMQAAFGVSRTRAYELLRSTEDGEDLGFRVLRIGRKYVVPTADVLAFLGIGEVARAST